MNQERLKEQDRGADDDFHFVENDDIKSCGTCSDHGGHDEDEQILSAALTEIESEQVQDQQPESQDLNTSEVEGILEDEKVPLETQVMEPEEGSSGVQDATAMAAAGQGEKESSVAAEETAGEEQVNSETMDSVTETVKSTNANPVPSAPNSVSPSQIFVQDTEYGEGEEDSQVDWDSVSQCVSNFMSATIPNNMLAVERLIERMSELGDALHGAEGRHSIAEEIASIGGQMDEANDAENRAEASPVRDLELVYRALEQHHVVQALQSFLSCAVVGKLVVDMAKSRSKSVADLGGLSVPHLCELLPALAKLFSDAPELAVLAPVLVRFVTQLSEFLSGVTKTESPSDTKSAPPTNTEAEVEQVEHRHVLCDGCSSGGVSPSGRYITGIRWKSAIHEDFDLCSTCEATGQYEEQYGPFLKITSPKKAPRELVVVLGDQQTHQPRTDRFNGSSRGPLQFHRRGDRLFNAAAPAWNRSCWRGAHHRAGIQQERNVRPDHEASLSTELTCPNNHVLLKFQAPCGFTCDSCSCNVKLNSILYGCRRCNFDLCQPCVDTKLNATKAASAATEDPKKSSKVHPMSNLELPQHQQIERPRARFVADISLPDGSIVSPNEKLVKTWRINNPGTESWPNGVRLVNVGGDAMQGKNGLAVPALAGGAQHDVKLDIVAPSKPGRYVGYWRLMTSGPEQVRFGHRLWIDLNVQEAGEPDVVLSELDRADRFHVQLARLLEMGFKNREHNLAVLDELDGNVEAVIAKLLAD